HHANHVREPHGCRETFAGNITNSEHQVVFEFEDADEITGDMAYGKDFAGNFKRLTTQIARAAESSLDLRGFVQDAAQIIVLTAQFGDLIFEREIGSTRFVTTSDFYPTRSARRRSPSHIPSAASYLQSGFQLTLLYKISNQPTNL